MEKTLQVATAFGLVLKRRRNLAQRTQEALGFEAELQRNFISELERGLKSPSLGTVCQLARALGCSAADMVNEAEAVMLGLQAAGAAGLVQPAVGEAAAPYAAQNTPAAAQKTSRRKKNKTAPADSGMAPPAAQTAPPAAQARKPRTKRR